MGLPSFFPHVTAWAKSATSNLKLEFTALHAFALIGIICVLYTAERTLDFIFFHFATPSKPLIGYRRRGPKPTYALITGASAGIGFATAKALVQQGFGVIILGHKEDELAEAAVQLREALVLPEDADPDHVPVDQYIRTIVLNAQTATPEEIEARLRETIVDQQLRVSILVNNVGGMPITLPPFRELATYSPADLDGVIDMNTRFMARLTTLMLPVLSHRGSGSDNGMSFGTHRRSLVLNLSSGARVGMPYLVMYGATKAFVCGFGAGLARELGTKTETKHIDVLNIVPGDVKSQGNCVGLTKTAVDAEVYGRSIVSKVDGAVWRGWREFTPHWVHHLENIILGLLPEKMATNGIVDMLTMKRNAMNTHFKPKDE